MITFLLVMVAIIVLLSMYLVATVKFEDVEVTDLGSYKGYSYLRTYVSRGDTQPETPYEEMKRLDNEVSKECLQFGYMYCPAPSTQVKQNRVLELRKELNFYGDIV